MGASIAFFGAGTALLVIGAKNDHPEPLCETFHWTDLILECDNYESQREFDDRIQKANQFKTLGVTGLLAGSALFGVGLAIFVKNRRLQDERLDHLFGPVQGMSLAPARRGRGASFNIELAF